MFARILFDQIPVHRVASANAGAVRQDPVNAASLKFDTSMVQVPKCSKKYKRIAVTKRHQAQSGCAYATPVPRMAISANTEKQQKSIGNHV